MKKSIYLYAVLSIVFVSTVLFVPANIFLNQQTEEKIDLLHKKRLQQTTTEFKSIRNGYSILSQSIYDNVINKEEIVSLVKRANAEDDAGKELLRNELYKKLLPLYKNLNKQNIRQLHFQLKNSVSFLRFHRPEKFGDSLEGVRYSINKVNRTFKPEYGFEEGRVFNGFRHVFPLAYKNKFAGTVEVSYSFNAIRAEQARLSSNAYGFILSKEIIRSKVWNTELSNYQDTLLSSEYLDDKHTLSQAKNSDFTQDDIKNINKSISHITSKKLQEQSSFLVDTKYNDKDVCIIFIPILNIENKQVAYFISYQYDTTLPIMHKTHYVEQLTAFFASIFLALFFVLYILSQKRAAHALELLATTDSLTRIANRNKLNIILEKSMHLSQRYNLPLSIIFFDIDHFKKVNDEYGHDAGDTVLTGIARLISTHIRSSDIFARWGGEEFIIVLPETDHTIAHKLAEKFRRLIQDYKFLPNANITCSFGVTQLHADDDEESLLKRVDNALYSAKEHGRNKVIEIS